MARIYLFRYYAGKDVNNSFLFTFLETVYEYAKAKDQKRNLIGFVGVFFKCIAGILRGLCIEKQTMLIGRSLPYLERRCKI